MPKKLAEREGRRVPLNMRTTEEIRDRLEAAASASGRSLTAEVEYRLEWSFREDDFDKRFDAAFRKTGIPERLQEIADRIITERRAEGVSTTSAVEWPFPPDMPIYDLGLSVRTANCLKNLGIETFGELCRIPDEGFRLVYNFGKVCLREVRELTGPPREPFLVIKSTGSRHDKTGSCVWIEKDA